MKQWRDVLLFLTGLGLIIYEATYGGPVRASLLPLYAGMIGLPLFLRSDEKRVGRDEHPEPQP